jgi:hypothetical protein
MLDLNKIKAKFENFFDETTEDQFIAIVEQNRRKEKEQDLIAFLVSCEQLCYSRNLSEFGLQSQIELFSNIQFNQVGNPLVDNNLEVSGNTQFAMAA